MGTHVLTPIVLYFLSFWLLLEETEGAIKNGQSRETGNIRYTKHRTKTNKAKHTIQKTKKRSNTDSIKKHRRSRGASSPCLQQDTRHVNLILYLFNEDYRQLRAVFLKIYTWIHNLNQYESTYYSHSQYVFDTKICKQNTNDVNKTRTCQQTTRGKDEPNIVLMRKF